MRKTRKLGSNSKIFVSSEISVPLPRLGVFLCIGMGLAVQANVPLGRLKLSVRGFQGEYNCFAKDSQPVFHMLQE